ncbi:MAG: NAD-dependent epimerase/dehydratase family protein [Candidatus Omnitrophota bacterium]
MQSVIKEDLNFIVSAKLPWGKLQGKKVLITGGSGFLPAYMAETILFLNDHHFKKRAKVYILGRSKDRVLSRFSDYGKRGDLQYIVQDVCIPFKSKEKFDFIIHAASQASPKYFGKDPVGTLSANVLGTYNLLELAKKQKVKGFLFFSSGEVYGEVNNKQIPVKEDFYGCVDPINVRSCYAESKRMGETMCVSWLHQYGVPVKIVRPFHTYGPGMRLDDGRVFADFVADIVFGRNIEMKSDGSAIRAFCYLADATVGFFTVLLKGENGQAYNVGNEDAEISIINLARLLAGLFPEKKLRVEVDMQYKKAGYIKSSIIRNSPDTHKLRSLGWEPHYLLKSGFKRSIESFYE